MSRDILFKTDEFIFSYRTAGILINNEKILLQHPENDTDYAIPGGHVSFGEICEQALVREYKEEIGADIKVESLAWVAENFFKWGDKPCHQICLYYYVSLADKTQIPLDNSFFGAEVNRKTRIEFLWQKITELKNITVYPTNIADLLAKPKNMVQHFVYREE